MKGMRSPVTESNSIVVSYLPLSQWNAAPYRRASTRGSQAHYGCFVQFTKHFIHNVFHNLTQRLQVT